MSNYSALIIDDEIENIQLLKIFIEKYCKEINIIYTGTTLDKATELCLIHKPQILFLDIKLDDSSTSFTLLENCKDINAEVIFVSSYEEYALKAISLNATAYLMKPVQTTELVNAVSKAIHNIETKKLFQESISKTEIAPSAKLNIIFVPSVNKIDFVRIDEILYLEADGRYTVFHLITGITVVAVKNIGEYEKLLDQNIFFRTHHHYIININMVTNINKSQGNFCELNNGKSIPIAKRRQEQLYKFLNLK